MPSEAADRTRAAVAAAAADTRPEPPPRREFVATPFDVEEQSASLIPQAGNSPDLVYAPTKCCCCCCDVDPDAAEWYQTLPSCPPCLYKQRVGNFYVCFSSKDKKHDGIEKIYCLVPMCWPMLCVTYSLISLVTVPMLYFTLQYVHPVWAAVELLSTVTLYLSLALTSFRDFGVFPRYQRKPPKDHVPADVTSVDPSQWRLCRKTASFRPPGVVFCDMSGVLVDEIDHFCPWTGTTIARKNLFTFYVFVVTLFVQIIVLVISLISVVHTRPASAASRHSHGHK